MNPKTNLVVGLTLGLLLAAGCSSPTSAPTKNSPAKAAPVAPASPEVPAVPEKPAEPASIPQVAQEAVERLTEPTVGGLQHEVSEATGFPQALQSLQEGMQAPRVDAPQNYRSQPPTRGLTADGASAELVDRDWTGVVLVPVNASFSKAYTSKVSLTSTEAHPLTDGRVRVWSRVRNRMGSSIMVEVACTFGMKGGLGQTVPRFYALDIPAGEYRDVFFVSPTGELVNYTLLVRTSN